MGNTLHKFFYFQNIEDDSFQFKFKPNISLCLSFYNYCIDQSEMIKSIIKSKIFSISIISIHDIIPTIIKTKKYYTLLKLLKFIKCSKKDDIVSQILEVNYVIYKSHILFHDRHKKIGDSILFSLKSYIKIGIHVRLSDKCLKECEIEDNLIYKIMNITKTICDNNCFIILSSFSNDFSKKYMKKNKNVLSYKVNQSVKHSSKSSGFSQQDIDKSIIDIYLTSHSDSLILSGVSTYSLLILYIGYYQDYSMCKSKKYYTWSKNILFDHLEKFRKKYRCKNISI